MLLLVTNLESASSHITCTGKVGKGWGEREGVGLPSQPTFATFNIEGSIIE